MNLRKGRNTPDDAFGPTLLGPQSAPPVSLAKHPAPESVPLYPPPTAAVQPPAPGYPAPGDPSSPAGTYPSSAPGGTYPPPPPSYPPPAPAATAPRGMRVPYLDGSSPTPEIPVDSLPSRAEALHGETRRPAEMKVLDLGSRRAHAHPAAASVRVLGRQEPGVPAPATIDPSGRVAFQGRPRPNGNRNRVLLAVGTLAGVVAVGSAVVFAAMTQPGSLKVIGIGPAPESPQQQEQQTSQAATTGAPSASTAGGAVVPSSSPTKVLVVPPPKIALPVPSRAVPTKAAPRPSTAPATTAAPRVSTTPPRPTTAAPTTAAPTTAAPTTTRAVPTTSAPAPTTSKPSTPTPDPTPTKPSQSPVATTPRVTTPPAPVSPGTGG